MQSTTYCLILDAMSTVWLCALLEQTVCNTDKNQIKKNEIESLAESKTRQTSFMYCLSTADNKLFNNQTVQKECLVKEKKAEKTKQSKTCTCIQVRKDKVQMQRANKEWGKWEKQKE